MAYSSTANGGANQSLARKHNSSLILDLLRLEGPLSRAHLAGRVGLTRSSVSRIVDELCADKLVKEVKLSPSRKGRPGMLLELDPRGGSAIGLEIGVEFLSILLTDFTAKVLWRERVTLPDDAGWEAYFFQAEELIQKAAVLASEQSLRLMGIGVAVWGLVDHTAGVIRFAPNLKWQNLPVKEKWQAKFQVPVYLENDANASALGEYYFGAGRYVEHFIYLSMDIGVGGGIISEGKLFRGANGYAGEIGHLTVDPAGVQCNCGKTGCLETLVGRKVILEKYRSMTDDGQMLTLEDVIRRGRSGDQAAKAVFQEAGTILGIGIGNLVNLFNPRRIILGWSLGQAYDLLSPALEESVKKNCLIDAFQRLDVVPFTNGADVSLLGCVALVLDEIIRERVSV